MVTIVDPEVAEDDVPGTTERVNQLIENKGGTVTKVERWGRRRLSYPIKHHTEGHYVLTQFKLDPQLTSELESEIQVSEDIIRHLIIRVEEQEVDSQEDSGEPVAANSGDD
ncbi:MAG: 30S ribosomal protein S6, partial [Dehalococcoidia bacterium]